MLKTNDIEKKSAKSSKTGVILVISESTVVLLYRDCYGHFALFWPMGKLKYQFSFQFPLNLTSTNTKVVISIHVISIFTELPCSSSSASFPVELQYLNNRDTNKHEILHVCLLTLGAHAQRGLQ